MLPWKEERMILFVQGFKNVTSCLGKQSRDASWKPHKIQFLFKWPSWSQSTFIFFNEGTYWSGLTINSPLNSSFLFCPVEISKISTSKIRPPLPTVPRRKYVLLKLHWSWADAGGFFGTGEKVPTHRVDCKEHWDLKGWTLKVEENTLWQRTITADPPKLPRYEAMQVSCPLRTPVLARMEMPTSHGSGRCFTTCLFTW